MLVGDCFVGVSKEAKMPMISLKFQNKDNREEILNEYFCDIPGCGNIATNVLGFNRELGQAFVVCDDCYRKIEERKKSA